MFPILETVTESADEQFATPQHSNSLSKKFSFEEGKDMQIPTEDDKLRIPKSEINPYEENKENEEPK